MEKLGYDKVEVDGLGNVIGWMGEGDKIIAIDSHIDTVGIGNIDNWTHDPYKGYEDDQVIYGRGGSDQEGGMASAVYGTKIMKDLGLIPPATRSWWWAPSRRRTATACAGSTSSTIFPAHNIKKDQVEFVISTEPTDGGIYRGHRGRMEIRVDVKGVSCHGSAPRARGQRHLQDGGHPPGRPGPEREPRRRHRGGKGPGEDAGSQVQPEHYEDARFLGRGTCTTSQIFYTSPAAAPWPTPAPSPSTAA